MLRASRFASSLYIPIALSWHQQTTSAFDAQADGQVRAANCSDVTACRRNVGANKRNHCSFGQVLLSVIEGLMANARPLLERSAAISAALPGAHRKRASNLDHTLQKLTAVAPNCLPSLHPALSAPRCKCHSSIWPCRIVREHLADVLSQLVSSWQCMTSGSCQVRETRVCYHNLSLPAFRCGNCRGQGIVA